MNRTGKTLLIIGLIPVVLIFGLMLAGQVVASMYGCPGDAFSLGDVGCSEAKELPGFVSFLENALLVGFIFGPIIAGPCLLFGAVLCAGGKKN